MDQKRFRIYIYGAGSDYNRFASYLNIYRDRLEVLGIITTKPQTFDKIDGYSVSVIDDIFLDDFDFIILASRQFWREMFEKCIELGIEEEKIIRSSVFELPMFDLDGYVRLKQEKVSILSNYCLGGLVYKELGLKMLSPTINMICNGADFFKFLSNYKFYLNKKMEALDNGFKNNKSYTPHDMLRFAPKGIIDGEIVWNFVHNSRVDEEIELWNKRRLRVNYENIAVVMIIQNEEEIVLFDKLQFSKKIGIYYKEIEGIDGIINVPGWDDPEVRFKFDFRWHVYANSAMLNTKNMISKIDWIKFLNGSDNFIRW